MFKYPAIIFFISMLVAACGKEQSPPVYPVQVPAGCDVSSVKYLPTMKQIIGKNCAYSGCHFPGTGNYDFTTYEMVAERIRSGRFTERILLPVEHALHMPVGFDMDSCELAKMMTWINNGFPNN
jgi:hypothetical protein